MIKIKPAVVLLGTFFCFTGCASNEIGDSKDVAQDKIFQDYTISYSEGNANVELYCQFRFAGNNGTTLVLNDPSRVQLDGEKIEVDSSAGSGAYYQTNKPASNFFGKHSLIYTTTDNKTLENSFSFDNFKLVNLPDSISNKQDFNLAFETAALQGDDYIELSTSNTDSSFVLTHTAADNGNFITVPATALQRQKVKELTLEATLYRKVALQQTTAQGGLLLTRYTLKPVKIKLAG